MFQMFTLQQSDGVSPMRNEDSAIYIIGFFGDGNKALVSYYGGLVYE